ncbi:beta 1-4 rhamnosyltransferase Cps2T [Streptococcus ictaluri]|uniref:DUF1972 domain-containing protein n=1 Tax=Streptococcus ictaluri 707-05 TaxID=764299 RepID=G5K3W6_9STRE|nr:DUF1972 domain-containing protein [Streptococcus ictaluri]EHI69371.1 hypothetical protein STRIC_1490 [Streptococcus ictaluri 707-05]
MQDVFIIGSRGLPAKYGGFETFVDEMISHQKSPDIHYHVACLSDSKHHSHFDYKGADCFYINPPKLGPARVIAYDILAITYALSFCQKHQIKAPIFYVLGNTIGAFMAPFVRKIHQAGGRFFINPDGLEWKRSKWSRPVQAYLKYAEQQMTKTADLVISDNQGIETYIQSAYPWSKTTFIAYGTETKASTLQAQDQKVRDYFDFFDIKEKQYYLILGRFVPENNYEKAISEFMASSSQRDLVIICNHDNNPYFEELCAKTACDRDKRVKFLGTQYDKDLVTYIREQAFAYIHGHEVGGTNPGLLEALAHTNTNLVLDVDFNRSVAKEGALYWSKEKGQLRALINQLDQVPENLSLGEVAKQRILDDYTWEKIVGEYEALFLNEH